MTPRESIYAAMKTAMKAQSVFLMLAVVAFLLFRLDVFRYLGPAYGVFMAGLLVYVAKRVRCPGCRYPFWLLGASGLRPGAKRLRINFCAHCGLELDKAPAGGGRSD